MSREESSGEGPHKLNRARMRLRRDRLEYIGSVFGAVMGAGLLASPYVGLYNIAGLVLLAVNGLFVLFFEYMIRTDGQKMSEQSTDAIAWMTERVIWMLIGALLVLLLLQFPEITGFALERATEPTDMPPI